MPFKDKDVVRLNSHHSRRGPCSGKVKPVRRAPERPDGMPEYADSRTAPTERDRRASCWVRYDLPHCRDVMVVDWPSFGVQ
jgi:hypothetical protein